MGRRSQKTTRRNRTPKKRKKHSIKVLLSIILLILLGVWFMVGFVDNEVTTIAKVENEEVDEIIQAEGDYLDIIENNGFVLKPNFREPTKGIIIYGNGGVSPKSYVPLGITLAKKGYLVVIPEFLFNSPNIGINTMNTIIKDYDSINLWNVVGHGSGGEAMSVNLNSDEKIKGAVFLASYPSEKADLSKSGLKVVSIKGTLDEILDLKLYEERKKNLPENTMFVQIENGNFSYFANYENDPQAEISKLEQQIQTSVQILNLMDQIR